MTVHHFEVLTEESPLPFRGQYRRVFDDVRDLEQHVEVGHGRPQGLRKLGYRPGEGFRDAGQQALLQHQGVVMRGPRFIDSRSAGRIRRRLSEGPVLHTGTLHDPPTPATADIGPAPM